MGDCPNPACHENFVVDLNKKADKTCLAAYLKKPPAWMITILIAAIAIPLIATALNVWAQQKVAPTVFASVSTCQKNTERIITLEENVKAIQEIKASMKEQRADFNQQMEEVKALIRLGILQSMRKMAPGRRSPYPSRSRDPRLCRG